MTPAEHGCVVIVGTVGVLIRGASGAGKSTLALDLVDLARTRGLNAALVADDRVHLQAAGGRLVARAPAAIAGLVEERGRGILAASHEPAAVVRHVIDLVPEGPERLPEPAALRAVVAGVPVRATTLRALDPRAALAAFRAVTDATA
ncbi:HPr kinase/phosphorylase [Prosthecomicrobium sp. N25]|uniref:HPr kinase/phosphorylase n=1 Tax=Prosthecomicrobium sp. N25 TaxID=3129254 RepID=UPI003076C7DD